MDSVANSRPRRTIIPPKRYDQQAIDLDNTNISDDTNSNINTNANTNLNTNTNSNVNDKSHAVPLSQSAGSTPATVKPRPKRTLTQTERGILDTNDRTSQRETYEQRQRIKARKVIAEQRGNATQPGPLPPPTKRQKGKQPVPNNILDTPLDQLTDDSEIREWLHTALEARDGTDYRSLELPSAELKEMWDEVPDADVTKTIENNTRGIKVANDTRYMLPKAPIPQNAATITPTRLPPKTAVASPTIKPSASKTAVAHASAANASTAKAASITKLKRDPIMTPDEIRRFQALYNHLGAAGIQKLLDPIATKSSRAPQSSTRPSGPSGSAHQSAPAGSSRLDGNTAGPAKSGPSGSVSASHPSTRIGPAVRTAPGPRSNVDSRLRQTGGSGHVPQRSHTQRSLPATASASPTAEERDGDKDEEDNELEQPIAVPGHANQKVTRKSEAQLWKFGDAMSLVAHLTTRLKLRTLAKCGYGDILPCTTWLDGPPPRELSRHDDDDPNDIDSDFENEEVNHLHDNLLEKWLINDWVYVNAIERPGKPMLELEARHRRYVRQQIPRVRFDLKEAIDSLIPGYYGLRRTGLHEHNKRRVEQLLPEAFHSSNEACDPEEFHHPIITNVLQLTVFNRQKKSLGYKFPDKFEWMPLSLIALICAITRARILLYSSGEFIPSKLNAEEQAPWYEHYIGRLRRIREHHPTRIYNLQRTLFYHCYQPSSATRALPTIEVEEREYGDSSSEEEFDPGFVMKKIGGKWQAVHTEPDAPGSAARVRNRSFSGARSTPVQQDVETPAHEPTPPCDATPAFAADDADYYAPPAPRVSFVSPVPGPSGSVHTNDTSHNKPRVSPALSRNSSEGSLSPRSSPPASKYKRMEVDADIDQLDDDYAAPPRRDDGQFYYGGGEETLIGDE